MTTSVVVTGASSGLGAELACQLAVRDVRLALLARRRCELERVAEQARRAAGGEREVRVYAVDVTDRAASRAVLTELERDWQGIDLLILNAGIGENLYVEDFDDQLAARIVDVNLKGVLNALGAVMPAMVRRRRGHIVGVSSIASYRGLPGASAYCASKAALSTLLESLRPDLRRYGVTVTTISPGFVRTPMTDKNRHAMPFRLEVEPAVRKMLAGIDRRRREVRFPWPMVALLRLLRAMPDRCFDWLMSRVTRPRSGRSPNDPHGGATD